MTDKMWAMIFSILGMLMNIIGFQAKGKKTLLLFQTLGSTLFLISFIFNASGMAVILNVIYLIRNFVYMYLDDKPQYNKLLCIVLSSVFLISYIVYTLCANLSARENLWNLAPIIASLFGTVAAACTDVNRYRMWKYGDSFFWLFFNARFGLGALGGVIGEVFNQISLTVGIIRYRKKDTELQE